MGETLDFANAPQKFTWQNLDLFGETVGFSSQNPRRGVMHEVPKRRGGRMEDQDSGSRVFDADLQFIGDDCAKRYAAFLAAATDNPYGLLVHPIEGRWNAFCRGPSSQVAFDRSINSIAVRVSWIESELDAQTSKAIPDVGTQAQTATAQQTAMEKASAQLMGAMAQGQQIQAASLAKIQDVMDVIDQVDDALQSVLDAITGAVGITANAITPILAIYDKARAFGEGIAGFVDSATDLYNGGEVESGTTDAVDTLLGTCTSLATDLIAAQIAGSPSPAGAADAVADANQALSECILLQQALAAERPPLISYLVTELTDIVVLCQKIYRQDAEARASIILSLNRIPNPAAIPAGTILRIPSR